jgi:hypothetical protein
MLNRLITALYKPAMEDEATGTFADGAFHLSAARQLAFDRSHSLRNSYSHDVVLAKKRELPTLILH